MRRKSQGVALNSQQQRSSFLNRGIQQLLFQAHSGNSQSKKKPQNPKSEEISSSGGMIRFSQIKSCLLAHLAIAAHSDDNKKVCTSIFNFKNQQILFILLMFTAHCKGYECKGYVPQAFGLRRPLISISTAVNCNNLLLKKKTKQTKNRTNQTTTKTKQQQKNY